MSKDPSPAMHLFKPALTYFALVFGAGFALALIRIPFLVPALGVRTAELIETPIMLAVIVVVSRRLTRRHPALDRWQRLSVGLAALVMMAAAELGVAFALGARSLGDYLASRDPVSGSVYLAALLLFALAPALWRAR